MSTLPSTILNQLDARRNLRNVTVGKNVVIRDFVNAYECEIGDETRIGTFVEIQKGARIGKRCKISSHSFICEGVTIGDGVFIGHGVMFTNDNAPKATNPDGTLQTDEDWTLIETWIEDGVSIGSNVTIVPGVRIGRDAFIGAGAVVTKDVPARAVMVGNPARFLRYLE